MDGLNHTQNRKSSSITADFSEVLNLNSCICSYYTLLFPKNTYLSSFLFSVQRTSTVRLLKQHGDLTSKLQLTYLSNSNTKYKYKNNN